MLDPVVQVGDAVLPLDDPGALQLDLVGSEAVEQPAALAGAAYESSAP